MRNIRYIVFTDLSIENHIFLPFLVKRCILYFNRYSQHPHIITLRGVYEEGGRILAVTELCRGGELLEHITQRRYLPEHEAAPILRNVLHAIHYLHRHTVVHR